jgi:hypothetical protein
MHTIALDDCVAKLGQGYLFTFLNTTTHIDILPINPIKSYPLDMIWRVAALSISFYYAVRNSNHAKFHCQECVLLSFSDDGEIRIHSAQIDDASDRGGSGESDDDGDDHDDEADDDEVSKVPPRAHDEAEVAVGNTTSKETACMQRVLHSNNIPQTRGRMHHKWDHKEANKRSY